MAITISGSGITSANIAADGIDGSKIADNALDSEHYTDDSIDADHLANSINTDIATGVTGGTVAAAALPRAGGTMSGNITGGDTTVSAVNLKDVGVTTNAIGSIGGGTQDIDLTAGNSVSGTVDTSTTTFTFSNPTASDELCTFSLILTNGGSQTVNFPATVDWAGGTAPTLTTAGVDILVFATIDGGTIWHGFAAALDSKTPS